MRTRIWLAAAAAAFIAACDAPANTEGPDARNARLTFTTPQSQFGLPGSKLPTPIVLSVVNFRTGEPLSGMTVHWQITQGAGAELTSWESVVDAKGNATTNLVLGPTAGTYIVRARVNGGDEAYYTARAVYAPEIADVQPRIVNTGDVVTITGRNFSENQNENTVMFGGLRAEIVRAGRGEIIAKVPDCAPSGQVAVRAQLGDVASTPLDIEVSAESVARLEAGVGQVYSFSAPNALACMRLSGDEYLVVLQNAAQESGGPTPFRVLSLTEGNARRSQSVVSTARAGSRDVQSEFEMVLREREAAAPRISARPQPTARVRAPRVGEERRFNAGWFNATGAPTFVTATLRAISQRALLYVDNEAAASLSDADVARLADLFDSVIYDTDTRAFGEPSDLDGNGRVMLLFSPAVNRLTPADAPGVITGYSTLCDLQGCADSNVGELLYMIVPDGDGRFGRKISAEYVYQNAPHVMAHELMHVIHYNQRQLLQKVDRSEDVWLAEALAHQAEDLVADVLEARGNAALAASFRQANYIRAGMYLENPAGTTLMSNTGIGTLEERGAGWLLMKYLVQRYGQGILRTIVSSGLNGSANVAAQIRTSWNMLLSDWAVALYADHAPELQGIALDARYTFGGADLRSAIARATGKPYPLRPASDAGADLTLAASLPVGGLQFVRVKPSAASGRTNVSVTGADGARLSAQSGIQVSVIRLR